MGARNKNKAARRSRILDASVALIEEGGSEALARRRIAQEAGVTSNQGWFKAWAIGTASDEEFRKGLKLGLIITLLSVATPMTSRRILEQYLN